MEWPRVKTILIILLLAVNTFLFGAYATANLRASRNQDQVRQEVCTVLEGLGYELNPEMLPADAELYYPARIARNTKYERNTIAAALEQVKTENSIGMNRYVGKKGELTLKSGGYIDATFDLGDDEAVEGNEIKLVESKLKGIRVSTMDMSGEESDGEYTVSGICSISGLPIFNCRIACSLADGKMTVIGRIPMGEISFLQNIKPYAVSGLMLNFAEYLQSIGVETGVIESISPGYAISSPTEFESGITELVPVWRISMNGEVWYINALVGEVVTLE